MNSERPIAAIGVEEMLSTISLQMMAVTFDLKKQWMVRTTNTIKHQFLPEVQEQPRVLKS